MFSFLWNLPIFPSWFRWGAGSSGPEEYQGAAVKVPAVVVHHIETATRKPARTLRHLIRLNHVNNAVLWNNQKFHNHMPHLLSSAFLLGGDSNHLNQLYEEEAQQLDGWADSPSEITRDDWEDYLGMKEYQRAFIDFFEDEIIHKKYNWEAVLRIYLFEGKQPLINNLIAGLTHPLIHLGYAYELGHKDIAVEALALAAVCHDDTHKYIDDPSYLEKDAPYTTRSILEILSQIRNDDLFEGVITRPGCHDLPLLFSKYEDALLDHWRAWDLNPTTDASGEINLNSQFQQAQYAAAALLVASSSGVTKEEKEKKHDFFLAHILTSLHAIRILLPEMPPKFHLSLLRQWCHVVVTLYTCQLRPQVEPDLIARYPTKGRDWSWVEMQALTSRWSNDAHFVKTIRALKVAEETWKDEDWWYLKAALKFVDEFKGWGGFGMDTSKMKITSA